MKFEKMIVTFENISQKKEVEKILINGGLKFTGTRLNDCLATYVAHNGFTDSGIGLFGEPRHTYQQFMEKYGMKDLKSKIEEAKNKTHMSLHQMSKAIGFNEHYLSAVVKRNRSESTQKKVIALLDDLIQKSQQELTHDFEGKALNTQVEDAMMISKSEYESMKKEIDHKTQIAEKHADMRAKAEAEAQELNGKMLLAEKDSEKWQCDFWTVIRENIELINSKRTISIWLAVSILIIVAMLAFGVLHFNGVV